MNSLNTISILLLLGFLVKLQKITDLQSQSEGHL